MAETKRISCAADVYTALSAGQANVSFRATTTAQGRYVIATSLPAPSTTDYVGWNGSQGWANFGSLAATDNVYFMPAGAAAICEVTRG